MRKCIRCQLVFHSDLRTHCLYCDSSLMDASLEELLQLGKETTAIEQAIKTEGTVTHERMQYIAGSYFKTKSFPFLYAFSRNELKTGKGFKRFFIQPLDFSFIVKIPWIIIDVVDSCIFHFIYTGYCPACNWKFTKITAAGEHTKNECEYNQEYSTVLNDILSGEIVRNETMFENQAKEKTRLGKRSAYRDLCSKKRDFELFIDIVTILLSISLVIYVLARLAMPIFGAIYDF